MRSTTTDDHRKGGEMPQVEERGYFQRRLREEIARCARFHDAFSLLLLEATPAPGFAPNRRLTMTAARLLERRLRTCDVVAAVFDDTVAVMLVGTGGVGLRDAEQRIRAALVAIGGAWRLNALTYPEDGEAIQALDILAAA